MTLPVSTSRGKLASRLFEEGCCGAVPGGVIGHDIGPAAPYDAGLGAGEDAGSRAPDGAGQAERDQDPARRGSARSGQSEAEDAAVIAEYLRLRCHKLQPPVPYSGETRASRTVVHTRDDLVDIGVAAANQLAALLEAARPGAKAHPAEPVARNVPTARPRRRD